MTTRPAGELPINSLFHERFRILKTLRHGGMGSVYLAMDTQQQGLCALKTLQLAQNHSRSEFSQRFLQEMETLKAFSHPHIVSLLHQGQTGQLLYYTMDFLPGGTLFERLQRESSLPFSESLCLTTHLARALHYSHRRRFVHRDVKPENIMFAPDGRCVLVDFGISFLVDPFSERLTRENSIMGTPGYIAPEILLMGGTPTGQSDVYSLGITLLEMLFGLFPERSGSAKDIAIHDREYIEQLPFYRLPGALAALCRRATAAHPKQRFPNAFTFTKACSMALRDLLTTLPLQRP